MNIFSTISILFLVVSLGLQAQTNQDYTVQAHAVVTTTPPSISIRWPKISTGVTSYSIYRKAKNDQSWGAIKGTASGTDTMWTDTDVTTGKLYEYNIQKRNGSTLLGITYLLSGMEIPAVQQRGAALVVVEKTLAASIPKELNAYLLDIASDGWNVFTTQVAKTDAVQFVKSEIQRFDSIAGGLTSVILLGHVPVPYSGNFGKDTNFKIGAPDGHIEHSGCWPADVYYAIDYDQWTDTATNTNGVRSENKNLPGDGKFDNTSLPAPVKYHLGRIDLSNMPLFPLSEAELTKQYFKKAHDFRHKITQTAAKGVINDQFGASNGANGSQAWRDFSVMFGTKNIIEYDYLTSCANENILF
ncbi:MAG: fibronectin type III domain-containing protein [Ignavibacteria bacterium]|nr:fibronectin type III domain-containing protein [Ignavibacteria bacterium]